MPSILPVASKQEVSAPLQDKTQPPHNGITTKKLPLSDDNLKQQASFKKVQEIPKIYVTPDGKKIYYTTHPFKATMLS